jgi:hypothetical protein
MALDLSSSSTLAEVNAAYEDNCTYDIENSVSMAQDFVQAARILMRRMVQKAENDQTRVDDTYEKYASELKKAEDWLKVNNTSTTARNSVTHHLSFTNFRD